MSLVIVFVDDEEDLCEIYEDLFEDDGLKIHTFTSTNDAIEFMNKNTVDFSFIDFRMPQMTGPELRTKIPITIKCFLLTGELDIKKMDGFVAIINKPISLETFQHSIK